MKTKKEVQAMLERVNRTLGLYKNLKLEEKYTLLGGKDILEWMLGIIDDEGKINNDNTRNIRKNNKRYSKAR